MADIIFDYSALEDAKAYAKNVVSANVVAANEKRKARFVPKKKRDIAVEQTK